MRREVLERLSIQLYEGFADNRLVLAVSSLDVHHLGDGHTACDPLLSRLGQVGNLGQVSVIAVLDQHERVVAKGVAVVRVEVGRERASSFVTEEVGLGRILACVGARLFSRLQLVAYQSGEQLLGLDQGNLYVAVRVSLQEQLLLDGLGKNREHSHGLLGQSLLNEGVLLSPGGKRVERVCLAACQKLVDLADQDGELRNELNHALRNDNDAKVLSLCGSLLHRVRDVIRDLGQGLLLLLYFLRNQADVRLALQSALQSHMGSGTAHNLDEVPVFLRRVAVSLNISNHLAVGLGSGIKTKGDLNILILQVAVDGLRAADHLYAGLVRRHVLGKHAGVGIGIIAADDYDSGDAVLLADLCGNRELLLGLQLGSSGTDDVEAAGISVLIDILVVKYDELILNESAGAALEANQDVLLVGRLQRVVKAADYVVSARRLSAGKNHAYNLLFRLGGILALYKGNLRLAVGVREKLFDLLLIRHAGSSSSLFNGNLSDTVSKHSRKLRNILISCFLKW